MEIIIGMALAFILGAYVRKPFEIKPKHIAAPQPTPQPVKPVVVNKKTKEEQLAEEFFNAMNFVGKPQEGVNTDETKA